METFALAHPGRPKEVALWCEHVSTMEDGTILFSVINGAWNGRFRPADGELLVEETNTKLPAVEVWRGEVPEGIAGGWHNNYDGAIIWIEDQIA